MNLDDITAQPFHYRITIPEEYLDIFQHMNVQYYLGIFSDSVFVMMSELGMTPEFIKQNNIGFYAVDQRLSYRAEVKVGDTVAVYSRLIARSSKSLHFMVFMVNETQKVLAATMEALAFHVNREAKRSAPFLSETAKNIDKRLQVDQALSWAIPLSQAIHVGL